MVVFVAMVVPMVWVDLTRPPVPPETDKPAAMGYPSELLDQEWYHRGVIEVMAAQWPRVDVVSYDSATTPGYHFVQATALRVTGMWWVVHALNALMGAALVTVVFATVFGVTRSGWVSAALTAPVVGSSYTIGGSIWMTTDNLCWCFVTLAVGGAALCRFTVGRGARLGVYAMCAVAVRQIHIWPIAVIGLAGLLRSPLAALAPKFLRDDARQAPRAWRYLWVGIAAAAAPAIVLGVFLWLWGGLLPASERVRILHVDGPNFAAPAFALATTASVGVFFLPIVWSEVRRLRIADLGLWLAAAIGLAAGLAVPTSYAPLARGGGWLWQVAGRLPVVMDRSVFIAAASVCGAVVIALLYRAAKRTGNGVPAAMVVLAALGWLCAQTMSTMAWQRYFDPMAMITVAMVAALGIGRGTPRWAWAGPVALGVFQAALTIATLHASFIRKVMEASAG